MPSSSKCPICGNAGVTRFRPFCSARCQTIDLARWIGGNYRVPAEPDEEAPEGGEGDAES